MDHTGHIQIEDVKKSIYKNYLKNVEVDVVFPGGESLEDLYERIKKNLAYFMNLDDDTLIITHRGVINMFYYLLEEKRLDMNKKQFGVTVASVHELDRFKQTIKRIK